jgi:hypothetical protein
VAVWILSPVLPPLAGMLSWSLLAFGVALLLRRSWIAAALPASDLGRCLRSWR